MEIILNGELFIFSDLSELKPVSSRYDLELVEPGFDEKSSSFFSGGVDSRLKLPGKIEEAIMRTSLLPVARIYKDKEGKLKLSAYFD